MVKNSISLPLLEFFVYVPRPDAKQLTKMGGQEDGCLHDRVIEVALVFQVVFADFKSDISHFIGIAI